MTIKFYSKAKKQLKKLDKPIQQRIIDFLEEISKLKNPRNRGKMLVGDLLGLWRYRVGNYRILCKIKDHELFIFVIEIGHRKDIYGK